MLVFFCTKRKTGNLHPLPITVFLDFLGVQLLIRIFGERKQPEGLTEEVFGLPLTEKSKKCGKPLPTSLRSATLPKGEGKESPSTILSAPSQQKQIHCRAQAADC